MWLEEFSKKALRVSNQKYLPSYKMKYFHSGRYVITEFNLNNVIISEFLPRTTKEKNHME